MSDILDPNDLPKTMTSVEAAQAYLQSEQNNAATFDMDALARSGLARWAGFNFQMEVRSNRIILTDKTTGLKTTCLYTEPMDMKVGKRIFRALARLKGLHDKALSANG